MPSSRIRQTLVDIGAIRESDVEVFRERTRDRLVPVLRDRSSGVIFIDEHYVGDDEYHAGDYRGEDRPTLEDRNDTQRRAAAFRPYYYDRAIADFGCGAGNFLRATRAEVRTSVGVELQDSYREQLTADGIDCVSGIDDVPEGIDAWFLFHVLEHLPDPLPALRAMRDRLNPATGVIVVEVPHARDLLISGLGNDDFIAFTLWSQHLVLHTRDSLTRLLSAAGFGDIQISGVQRYGLGNHLTWLSRGVPGGHKGPLSGLESGMLAEEYESALARLDATDTLVAVARVAGT